MMNELIKEVESFSKALEEKGYDGNFYINMCYPAPAKECIMEYLYRSLMGKGDGLSNGGFYLTALWMEKDAGSKDKVDVDFEVEFVKNKLVITEMTTILRDENSRSIKSISEQMKGFTTLPTKQEALKKIFQGEEPNLKKKRRLKM